MAILTDEEKPVQGMDLKSGGHNLNHGLNDNQEMERKYCDWVEDCEANQFEIFDKKYSKWDSKCFDENGKRRKFVDVEFDVESDENFGNKKCTWVRAGPKASFIVKQDNQEHEIDAFDISQGRIGDCWFLSSISALAQKRKLVKKVLMPQYNNQKEAREHGIYRFRFYHMGEWMDVIIDDQLPKKYSAKPNENEYWVCLVEKAYAKFFGGYRNIIGGDPIWALCNLTGGITLECADLEKSISDMKKKGFCLFEFIQRIQKDTVFAVSNTENKGEDNTTHAVAEMGLVAGHAYSMLEAGTVTLDGKMIKIVKIRNPWAKTECKGDWNDNDEKWNKIKPEEKKKYHSIQDDGCFWMLWEDCAREFETLSICYMPNEESGKNHRVIGDFWPGKNAPLNVTELSRGYLKPEMTHQIEILVDVPDKNNSPAEVRRERSTTVDGQAGDVQEILIQFLIDHTVRDPHYLTFNLFTDLKPGSKEYSRKELKKSTRITPILPIQEKYEVTYYRHNGFIYHLKPGRYIAVVSAAPKKPVKPEEVEGYDPTEFMIRMVGDNIRARHLF